MNNRMISSDELPNSQIENEMSITQVNVKVKDGKGFFNIELTYHQKNCHSIVFNDNFIKSIAFTNLPRNKTLKG